VSDTPIVYVSDLEGQWPRLVGFVVRTAGVRLVDDRLDLEDGVTFVFGGDAVDRGPNARRIVRTLLEAKRRYGDRVVLLAGNRDINKLRLRSELRGRPPARAPAELHGDPAALLRFIMGRTMNAGEAFDHRATELREEGLPDDDGAVVESFLADLEPAGDLTRLLEASQLAWRSGPTLFVHGSVTRQSLLHVPGRDRPCGDVDDWVAGLNTFMAERLAERWRRRDVPPEAALIAYQAPQPGLGSNPASVVYGRTTDAHNNPGLPPREVVERLLAEGVQRLVVGHTPHGDAPVLLRAGGFELLVADNSRGRVAEGAGVRLEGDRTRVDASVVMDDGERIDVHVDTRLSVDAGPLGRRAPQQPALVKARLADGRYLAGWCHPGFVQAQCALHADELALLEEPWLPASDPS